jgi:hypothetical protein
MDNKGTTSKFLSDIKVPFNVAIGLLFGVITVAIVPGFFILGYYQSVVMTVPQTWSVLAAFFYLVKLLSSTLVMAFAVILYADITFPLVMISFGAIFSRIQLK